MSPRDIPKIRDAEVELQKAETSFPSRESAEMFQDAFESLDDFVQLSSPSAEVVEFIDNLKLSYIRTIAKHLNEINTTDFDQYVHYSIILFVRMPDTLNKLTAMDREINKVIAECKTRFRPQIEELIRQVEEGDG